jgi:hypothetical protein
MTLRKSDGTPYRLNRTNPFMMNQEIWNGDFTLHNFKFKELVVPDTGQTDYRSLEQVSFVDELAEAVQDITKDLPPVESVKVETPPPKVTSVLKHSPNKVVIYCLPGVVKKVKDELYGDMKTKIDYTGEPFTFEGIILLGDDISLTIWCPTDQVTVGSVLYPQNGDKRWWRVSSVKPNTDGWMLEMGISDFQPRFRATP